MITNRHVEKENYNGTQTTQGRKRNETRQKKEKKKGENYTKKDMPNQRGVMKTSVKWTLTGVDSVDCRPGRRPVGKAQSGRCRPVEKVSGRRRPVEKRQDGRR